MTNQTTSNQASFKNLPERFNKLCTGIFGFSLIAWYILTAVVTISFAVNRHVFVFSGYGNLNGGIFIAALYLIPILYAYFSWKDIKLGRKIILSLVFLVIAIPWLSLSFSDDYNRLQEVSVFGTFFVPLILLWIPFTEKYFEPFTRIVMTFIFPILFPLAMYIVSGSN